MNGNKLGPNGDVDMPDCRLYPLRTLATLLSILCIHAQVIMMGRQHRHRQTTTTALSNDLRKFIVNAINGSDTTPAPTPAPFQIRHAFLSDHSPVSQSGSQRVAWLILVNPFDCSAASM
ncbi:hypothetical protein ACLKA6_008617 [Drosophila palustris]